MLRVLLPAALLFSSCENEAPVSHAPPPTYQTLHHPKSNGAFFQFEHDGDSYLACSIHQANLKPGTALFRNDEKDPVTVGKKVHTQNDLHVWTFSAPSTGPDHLLTYRENPEVAIDDRIFLLNRGEKIAARVVALPQGDQFRVTYQTDQPFAAGGMSGSPVYLPRTGSVIGVLQTANDKKKATLGGFELLKFP